MNDAKKRLLLVDDEEVILFGFKQVLSSNELQVDAATCVDEAKTLLKTWAYDAAIIDLRLSNSADLEGLELAFFLKKTSPQCRIIILTAYGDEATRLKAKSAGVDLFLEKPTDPETIRKRLSEMGI